MDKRIIISMGSDHAGYDVKARVLDHLRERGYAVIDHGAWSGDSVDYPDFIHPVAGDVTSGEASFGVIMCGSGSGAAMTANRHRGIRAAICWTDELARLARQHNNANVLSIPARFVDIDTALSMTDAFLSAEFEGGRHTRRVDKIETS